MKVLFGILAVALFVLVTSFTPTAAVPAGHEQPGGYSGVTDQGHNMNFNVVAGSPNYIDNWGFGFNIGPCTKTGKIYGVGMGFGGFHVDIINHEWTFDFLSLFFYFKWTGKFTTATHAKGTALTTWAAMADKNSVEKCPSGRRTWEADHVLTGAELNGKFDRFIQVTRDPATGKIDVSVRD